MIDLLALVIGGYGFYIGYSKGIIQTFFTVIGVVLGFLMAVKFTPGVVKILESALSSKSPILFIAGFLLTFVGSGFLLRLLSRGVENTFKTLNINSINQISGGVLFAFVLLLFYSLLIWFSAQSKILSKDTLANSATYPYLMKLPANARLATNYIKPLCVDFWDYSSYTIDRLRLKNADDHPK
jgi:uncharacterized membrane protein required for colicin V production